MRKRKYVRTRSLKKGMRIDQAIIDKKGRTLIARGAYLDDFMIDSLLQRGVGGIYTSEGEDEPDEEAIPSEIQEKIEKLKVADPAKVKLTESVKNRVCEGIQYLYQNTESESFTDTTNNIANNLMKQHTLFGYQILKDKPDIKEEIRLGVLQHHEKINGKGYPLGLSRNKINSYAKILAVADIYDALVTKRPYKTRRLKARIIGVVQ